VSLKTEEAITPRPSPPKKATRRDEMPYSSSEKRKILKEEIEKNRSGPMNFHQKMGMNSLELEGIKLGLGGGAFSCRVEGRPRKRKVRSGND